MSDSTPATEGDAFTPHRELHDALLAAVTRYAEAMNQPMFLATSAASALLHEEAGAMHAQYAASVR